MNGDTLRELGREVAMGGVVAQLTLPAVCEDAAAKADGPTGIILWDVELVLDSSRATAGDPDGRSADRPGSHRDMTDKPIELDQRRSMQAQKATDLRRLLAEVKANEEALCVRQEALEAQLIAAPSEDWEEAMEKVRYLLRLYAATLRPEDTRGRILVAAVLADLARLGGGPPADDG